MDQERARIQEDLRGLLDGEVRCDDVTVHLYASDASIYEIAPLGVVRPASVEDVIACVQYAAEHHIPIHARGAGSGLAGESLGPGLIVDFSQGMRRIVAIDDDTATVQAGVTLSHLNEQLRRQGTKFGPDPTTRSITTMGSVISQDASGSHWLKYGSARDNIVRMQAVLADGTLVEIGPLDKTAKDPDSTSAETSNGIADITHRLAQLIQSNRSTIESCRPQTKVDRCGYRLYDIETPDGLDMCRFLCGTEGTLALITEATVRVVRRSPYRGVALLFFDRLESAAKAALEITGLDVSACDLLDRRLLSIARETDVRFEMMLPAQAEAMLLVECDSDDAGELRERLDSLVNRIHRRRKLAFDHRTTTETDERNLYWRLTRRVIPTLYRLKGQTRAIPFVEDMAIPPQSLPGFLIAVQNVMKAHQVTASVFGHAGHGQMHIRPFLDLMDPADVARIEPLAEDLYSEVAKVHGTISGEHAVGLSRTWFMKRHLGPMYPIMAQVKRIFDPQHLLNPGKVISDAPQSPANNLRPAPLGGRTVVAPGNPEEQTTSDGDPLPLIDLELPWDRQELFHATRMCNGCGRCRATLAEERMCPIFRALPSEEASPRAKANLVRGVLTGRLPAEHLESDEFKEVADLCVNCHQCRLECPASVDIPRLMQEAKAQYVRVNGLKLSMVAMARIDRLVSWAASAPPVANWAIRSPWMRWFLDRVLGIAQGRKLPRINNRSFLRWSTRQRMHRLVRGGDRKVAFFADTFVNWHDSHLAQCFISILRHNGISVYVPNRQVTSGMALITHGAVDRARKLARRNVTILAEAIRHGYQVVTTEPAAALCLTHEYPNLLDDEEARIVAENSHEACSYLWGLHQTGQLELDFKPVNHTVGYHLPCHQRALGHGDPGKRLLQLIPGLTVRGIDKGCSGMAGTWGMMRKNYRRSLRIGWGLISSLRDPQLSAGSTECSACRIQMEQGTSKPTIHPLKFLALAYGLHPEVADLIKTRSGERVISSI